MRIPLKAFVPALLAAFCAGAFLAAPAAPSPFSALTAFSAFQPAGHCLNGTVEAIISPPAEKQMTAAVSSARRTLDIMLFQFSSSAMKEAVARAIANGAKVRIILEPRVDANIETARFLSGKGAEVRWATTDFAYTHAKLAIIDGDKTLVGSINWSKNALTANREAEVLVSDAAVAKEFMAVFERDWAEATPAR